jgi:hypothetical protein
LLDKTGLMGHNLKMVKKAKKGNEELDDSADYKIATSRAKDLTDKTVSSKEMRKRVIKSRVKK